MKKAVFLLVLLMFFVFQFTAKAGNIDTTKVIKRGIVSKVELIKEGSDYNQNYWLKVYIVENKNKVTVATFAAGAWFATNELGYVRSSAGYQNFMELVNTLEISKKQKTKVKLFGFYENNSFVFEKIEILGWVYLVLTRTGTSSSISKKEK